MKTTKRIISFSLVIILCLQLFSFGAAADSSSNSIKSFFQAGKEKVSSVFQKTTKVTSKTFEKGWDLAAETLGDTYAAVLGNEYINVIGNKMAKLEISINDSYNNARSVGFEKGFVAEKWHAGTYNIDAAVKRTKDFAECLGSTELGSVDIHTNTEDASSKYWATGKESAEEQAKSILEGFSKYKKAHEDATVEDYLNKSRNIKEKDALDAFYSGQTRIIPADQMSEAVDYLKGKVKTLSSQGDTAGAARYQETLDHLRDRLKSPKGTQSKPLTNEEAEAITELAKEGKFKLSDFGLKMTDFVSAKDIMAEAVMSGVQAGTISAALAVAPALLNCIVDIFKHQEIDAEELKSAGIDAALAGSAGFIEGGLCNYLTATARSGILGPELMNASPAVIGALTVLMIRALRNGYALAKGQINGTEYSNLLCEDLAITVGSMGTSTILMALGLAQPVILIGCVAGGILAQQGFKLTKGLVLKLVDNDGFLAGVPATLGTNLNVVVDRVELPSPKTALSKFVSVVNDAYDKIVNGVYSHLYDSFCPRCGTQMVLEGNQIWVCNNCNYSITLKKLKKTIYWFCDGCGAFMNDQKGFNTKKKTWKCRECGMKNDVSEANIVD